MPSENLEQYANNYFTGTQATIWIGDIWIDECVGIQFQANQSMIPVYGYGSRFFDMIARGKVLVQGVFEINFIDEGYLFAALQEGQKRLNLAEDDRRSRADVIKDQLDLLKEVNRDRVDPETANNVRERNRQDIFSTVVTDLANLNVAEADELLSKVNQDNQTSVQRWNVIYDTFPFRITGYFGNPEVYGKQQGVYKEIQDCFLIANEVIVGDNDQPVRERYSFISRRHI